ncbi:MAG: 2-amino-4-hydroxy-6-hydroxymethyldihydropteridine diphosphokinase [Rickettsiales bacterium]|nr:2-amino-4-hydroxy-6-hydroxymethyldihydropteridine diphosphokinase [Rickettsiales bacterium]
MARIIFGLGSNLGDRKNYLTQALKKLEDQLALKNIKQSKILKNPALLLPNSPIQWNQEFFNQAISADIDLEKFSPLKILKIIKEIEKSLGRQKLEKWAPREIDIDILLIENLVINIADELIIPHAQIFNRDFVIQNITEIEPNWRSWNTSW